mgnify:CR=1 FL=1
MGAFQNNLKGIDLQIPWYKLCVITGLSGSGKSSLAIHLAKKYNGIIINADSQQIYKELPILSSQPNKKDYKEVSHKLFNFLDFYKNFSVSQWFKLVKKEIKEAVENQKTLEKPIFLYFLIYFFAELFDQLFFKIKLHQLINSVFFSCYKKNNKYKNI